MNAMVFTAVEDGSAERHELAGVALVKTLTVLPAGRRSRTPLADIPGTASLFPISAARPRSKNAG
jgi:hypothetical protein